MTKRALITIGAAVLASAATTWALPIPSSIDIDFRSASWSGAHNQGTFALGGVTVSALPSGSVLRHATGDGLGIDGSLPNRIEDPSEVGPLETLVVNFSSPTSLLAAYLNDLYPQSISELVQDSGWLELYNGSSLIDTYAFTGSESSGEKTINFNAATLVTRVEFKVYFGNNPVEWLANRDFAVAGFDVQEVVVPVADNGLTLVLLGGGLLGLGLVRRSKV
ncbi:MAG: hypothetical protein JNK85_01840 [Verrucomicrobiales bacterium]|nr:hypothetical protein [Verrucomicrobiales bacterium]